MTGETLAALENLAWIGERTLRLYPWIPQAVALAAGLITVTIMALLVLGSMRP